MDPAARVEDNAAFLGVLSTPPEPPRRSMTQGRQTFHWRPDSAEPRVPSVASPEALRARLSPLVEDRASGPDALVREVARELTEWVTDQGDELDWANFHRRWLGESSDLRASHDWRATLAHLFDTLDDLPRFARENDIEAPVADVVAEELGLWLGGLDRLDGESLDWDGRPLAEGARLPDRTTCVDAWAADLEPGELIAVHGYSSTVVTVLSLLHERGLAPRALFSEGGPDLGGRRMAKELAPLGIDVRLCYDAALPAELASVDRFWVGTEALGAGAFLGRVGTTTLLREARRLEVPVAVLATSDKWMPRGALKLPAWCERDGWLLWENAPEGVELASQAFELVPLSLIDVFSTERGFESAAQFSLRALRTVSRPTLLTSATH